MQKKGDYVYKETAKQTGKSLDLVKSVGDSVFSELNQLFKDPLNLIHRTDGLGDFYLRSERYKKEYTQLEAISPEQLTPEQIQRRDYLKTRVEYLDSQYDLYREEKRELVIIRDKFNEECENGK